MSQAELDRSFDKALQAAKNGKNGNGKKPKGLKKIEKVPRSVAVEIADRQAAGSEIMYDSFGEVQFSKSGGKVEVSDPEGAIYALIYYAELGGTSKRAATQMVKVARRWEDAIGKPGLHSSSYEREPEW